MIPFLASVLVFLNIGVRTALAQCSHLSPPPVTDTPDDGFTDTNSDGIDGMRCGPIFVSPVGDDRNLGSIDAPMKTLGAAILAAKWFSPPRSVYVSSNGSYSETVVFVDGVNVYGGYHHMLAWSRDNAPASVSGGRVAAWVEGLTSPLNIDRLAITAANNTTAGGLSIGLVSRLNSASLDLRASEIRGGNVTTGASGGNGTSGAAGNNGAPGGAGDCDANGPGGPGGPGGSSPVGNTGGAGGRGGSYGSNSGVSGGTGLGPAGGSGGSGGSGGDPGSPGANGQVGGNGPNGSNGTSGSTFYVAGGNGVNGVNGSGGGGGGGGGGQGCTFCNDGQGNGGGGGGGGGGPGTGGFGGIAGGSSYGLLAVGTMVTARMD
jgi:hypothetical protein